MRLRVERTAALCAAVAAAACVTQAKPAAPEAPPEERRVRPAAEAGTFYTADPAALQAEVRGYLAAAKKVAPGSRMVLVPHAGLRFSGQIAAESFKQVAPGFTRAVIIAANHNNAAHFGGTSVDRSTHYAMPGFEVKVATAVTKDLLGKPGFADVPAAFANHTIEIELPFLREANAGAPFEIVPLVMGRVDMDQARALAQELARLDEPKTVFVFSVDLSHYYTWEQAVALDRPCLAAIEQMDAEATARCDVDGPQVLLTMVYAAALTSRTPHLLAYRNSGDVPPGDRSRVVGYGALVFEDRFWLGDAETRQLLALARKAFETRVRTGQDLPLPPELARWPRLLVPRGAFVTLRKKGDLRGCIGSLSPQRPLAQDVLENAVSAAIRDPRFPPVAAGEIGDLDVSVSVLDLPRPLEGFSGDALLAELGRTRPGVILEIGGRRSTFLPEVWDELPQPAEFLLHLSRKQGSPPDAWRDPSARFWTYGSQHFGEKP